MYNVCKNGRTDFWKQSTHTHDYVEKSAIDRICDVPVP